MSIKRLMTRAFLIGQVLAALLGIGLLVGCAGDNEVREGPESGGTTAGQEVSERGDSEQGGEHGGAGKGTEGSGPGSEKASGANLMPDEAFDMVHGARLVLSYDAASNSFNGTVENTTNSVLTNVRIEVHQSNGTELGPTTPWT